MIVVLTRTRDPSRIREVIGWLSEKGIECTQVSGKHLDENVLLVPDRYREAIEHIRQFEGVRGLFF